TNWSYPAFSNGSADGDPGSGDPASGDTVGTINGFLQWDPYTSDTPSLWMATLRLRDLRASWGPVLAPATVTVDVTPRRLQEFQIQPGQRFIYSLRQAGTGALKRIALATADVHGALTIPAVPVSRPGMEVRVLHFVGGRAAGLTERIAGEDVPSPRLVLSRNP